VIAALALPTAMFYRSMRDFQRASEAEARAEASRARLASIVEAGTDALITADPRGRLVEVSQVGRRLLALEADQDVSTLTLEDVFPSVDAISLRNEGIPAAARTGLWSSELTMLGRDGGEIPVAVIALAHRDASGEIASYSFVARNITERRRSEAALRQTQKLESLGTLAGGIAHDFNNLLMAIMGFAGLLKRSTSLSEADRDRVLLIEEAARNGGDFTGRLLAFARGGLAHIGPVDLRTVISDTLRLAAPTLQRRLSVTTSLPDHPVMVESDFTQLEQAILNIVLNARDAMPDGGNLTVRLWRDGDDALISVQDTGIGMDEATRLRIFEPFYTTKPTGVGTGLGLAMSYGIVHGHRGQLTVESTPGVGSTFTIRLPGLKVIEGAPSAVEDDTQLPAILVVDDDELVRRSLTATLAELGFHAIGVGSGSEAVAVIRNAPSRFMAVLLDLVMPGMTGGETYRQISAIRSDLPVIVCTGYAADSQIDDDVKRRIAGLIQKPFSAEKLESVLRRIGVEPPDAPPEAVSIDESVDIPDARTIRVLLVDDHDVVRQALRSLLEIQPDIEVAGDFDNARVALKGLKALNADVVLMDSVMPSLNGIDATRQFLQKCPELKIILLSGFVDEEQLREAVRAGASGYFAKTADITELIEAIKTVYGGRSYFSHSIAERFKLPQILKEAAKAPAAKHELLTPREREILQLIAEGYSSQDIVGELGLSMKTVEVHRYHLNKKLNAHTQSDLVRYAIRNGIVRLETSSPSPAPSPKPKSGGVAAKRS
ncbi:MAG TPA: response regulator, partial [Tepidiformaceae bacterium]